MTTANLEHDEPDVAFEKTVNNVREKSKWPLMVSDFGNMLKAFIGSNYLTIAYAFTQSGILMGVILLTIIAAVTDHCCHLIVKCKYEAIKHVLSSREAYKSSPTSSVNGFSVSSDWELYKWATLPVFFGMVTSAFEGIGTILPIESSMEGNRHNFSPFLHGSIVILSMVLTTFGIVGYLRYGETTEQILNKNIPTTTAVGMAINICLLFGVILTFPLQIFPVIEISEIFIFGHGHQCDSTKKDQDNEDLEDGNIYGENSNAKLLPKRKAHAPDPVIMTLLNEVSSWKRNILRILIVLCAAGLAILLRDLFAYVSAFIGAIGSSVIAYILPCLFHLKLCWHKIGFCVRFKDICIIVFGTAASILSLYTTIKEVVEKF